VIDGPLQRGMVAVFLSTTFNRNFIGKSLVYMQQASWIQYGEHAYDWFGFHVNFFVDKNYVSYATRVTF
jgi:hypothetical protein